MMKTPSIFLANQQTNRVRSDREMKIINRAKELLMDYTKLAEDDAYRLLRKTSMEYRKPICELAEAVLISFSNQSFQTRRN